MSKPAILCIDDERVILTGLRAQLKREFGNDYLIELAESGEEAYEIVEEFIEDKIELPVVISDQIMPGMKGDEVLALIKEKSERTLNIMLTGQADAAAVGRAINTAGLYRYIAKPWDETDLNMTVREALKSYRQAQTIFKQNRQLEKLVEQLREHNENLEEIVSKRTEEVVKQKKIIENKNDAITGSIRYAQKIQHAVLPPSSLIKKHFPESFIMYEPRDIVSGDFYWITKKNGKIIATAADCTGHGVPGAFMSMLGISFLNEIVNKAGVTEPDDILNNLRKNILESFHKHSKEQRAKDGIDLSIISVDENKKELEFSGAYNSLLLVRDGEIRKFKADRMPAGHYAIMKKTFSKHTVRIKDGDCFYMLSDGYSDQFGGPYEKKYMMKRFKKLILNINEKPMSKQKEILESEFKRWKGKSEQIDDVVVFGIRF